MGGYEEAAAIRRLVLCTGKVYYDLIGSDARAQAGDAAVARVEALYPFPDDEVRALDDRYPNLETVVWAQEEPENMGALPYIGPRLHRALPTSVKLVHVTRPERASPAEGKIKDHVAEQQRIAQRALVG